jgi:hypothetical protein
MDRLVEFHKVTRRGVLTDGMPQTTKIKKRTEKKRFIMTDCNTYCFNSVAFKLVL